MIISLYDLLYETRKRHSFTRQREARVHTHNLLSETSSEELLQKGEPTARLSFCFIS